MPEAARAAVEGAWGAADGPFGFRFARFGNVTVAMAPDRGRSADRRVEYHDPALPPRHALVAFGLWMREALGCHALVHVGAHGTLEWLPGKTVALSEGCFPEVVTGALPVVYPFIVSNPGEAAQAKRRIGAVTLGHLTPPLVGAGLSEAQRQLERLVDEYAQADGLDRRRRERLARLIVEQARETGLAGEAGVGEADDPEAALVRIDAWLCDLKDFAVKDGLHVFGRAGPEDAPERLASRRGGAGGAAGGARRAAGGAGAVGGAGAGADRTCCRPGGTSTPPIRGRCRRRRPSRSGKAAADEVLRRYVQEHGDWPRALVIDLWGSASLRTGRRGDRAGAGADGVPAGLGRRRRGG